MKKEANKKDLVKLGGCKDCLRNCKWNGDVAVGEGNKEIFGCNSWRRK